MKKALALLLALVMTLALAACGGNNDKPADPAPAAPSEPAKTPEPPPADDGAKDYYG